MSTRCTSWRTTSSLSSRPRPVCSWPARGSLHETVLEPSFAWDGPRAVGLTPCGLATVDVLNINARHRIELRELLIRGGVFPPDE